MINNSITTNRNTMFNTSRFIDVTTPRQCSNGTTFFLDSQNPGVYYGSYRSGYVRRVIATHTSHANLDTGAKTTWTTDSAYQINSRCDSTTGNGITSVLLPRSNDRLSRIQEMANKFDRDIQASSTSSNSCILISPRLR